MGLVFDIYSAELYEKWYRSPAGRAMDQFVEKSIADLLKPQKHERVLDIGCGTGNHLLSLNKLGLDINGVDASPYMINIARKRLGNRCTLKTGLAEELPFDDNEFDLAVLINTLEFLDEPLNALKEAGRVARKKVFIVSINSLSSHFIYGKMRNLFSRSLFNEMNPRHIWELKNFIRIAYGPVPVAWRSGGLWPSFSDKDSVIRPLLGKFDRWPFGSFLGISATIQYTMKTDNLPLKLKVRKSEQSIARGVTTMGDLPSDHSSKIHGR